MSAVGEGKLPVFVFPTSLTFFSDDQASHKQVLTLYNPYDFSLTFKVLSTSPQKYNVIESEGLLRARCCVDIVVRHKDINPFNEERVDKFRIQVCEHNQRAVLGRRDIPSILRATGDQPASSEENFESLPALHGQKSSREQTLSARHQGVNVQSEVRGPSVSVLLIAALSLLTLFLPSDLDPQSSLPHFLRLQTHHKLVAAYILGLVTMVILRS